MTVLFRMEASGLRILYGKSIGLMDYSFIAILGLVVTLMLLVAEIFLPSGGFIAILALLSLGAAIWAAWFAWWDTSPGLWWSYIAGVVIMIPTTLGFAVRFFPNTTWGKKIIHEVPTLDEVTGFKEETEHLRSLLGKVGKTQTLLNPSGFVLVNNERLHCESQGMIIESNEDVEVIAVEGTRLVVKVIKVSDEDSKADSELAQRSDSQSDDSLDFEIPES